MQKTLQAMLRLKKYYKLLIFVSKMYKPQLSLVSIPVLCLIPMWYATLPMLGVPLSKAKEGMGNAAYHICIRHRTEVDTKQS